MEVFWEGLDLLLEDGFEEEGEVGVVVEVAYGLLEFEDSLLLGQAVLSFQKGVLHCKSRK